jgi:GNAT acetyltransferase-like protein
LHAQERKQPAAPRLEVLRGVRALAAIVPAWEELAANAIEPNPFYEPWMLLPALECFAGGHDLRSVAVWCGDGKLGLLLPLRRSGGVKGLALGMLGAWRNAHYLLCTPLVRAGAAARECLLAMLDWLAAGSEGAAALELRYFPSGGAFHALLADALNQRRLPVYTIETYSRALLRRAADAPAYIDAALSRSMRRTLERKEAQLRALGTLEYRTLRPEDDVASWIEDFLQLEAASWKGRAGSAMACSAANRRFAEEAMRAAARRGRLLMSGIDFDRRPIARLWCYLAGQGSYGFKTAYDEAFRAYMPGFLAELHNVRVLHAMPRVQWMDSYTDAGGSVMDRLWKDRLTMQSVLVAARGLGGLAMAALPLFRWAKQRLARARAAAGG